MNKAEEAKTNLKWVKKMRANNEGGTFSNGHLEMIEADAIAAIEADKAEQAAAAEAEKAAAADEVPA